jgi:crossover junction endodeoxyribonuclease RuvC
MKVLAIDPGYDKLGYAVFSKEKSTPEYIKSGLIKTSKALSPGERLLELHDNLFKVINKEKPDTLAIERLFFTKNVTTALGVSQSVGIVLLLAAQNKLQIIELTPNQIKEIITGYGNSDKKSVQKMLWLQLGREIKVKDDDESDAIACGMAACVINRALL